MRRGYANPNGTPLKWQDGNVVTPSRPDNRAVLNIFIFFFFFFFFFLQTTYKNFFFTNDYTFYTNKTKKKRKTRYNYNTMLRLGTDTSYR